MHFDVSNHKVLLYGDALIQYEETEIKADFIEINWMKNIIYATGKIDSLGEIKGSPKFKGAREGGGGHTT